MNQQEFIGTMVLAFVPLFAIIAYFAKGAWSLSKSITKLETTLESINGSHAETKKKVDAHDTIINDHESRISVLESHVL